MSLRLLAIDIGAASGRAVVGDFDGERLTVDEAHRFPNVAVRLGGTLYWDVLRILADVQDGVRRAGEVAALGVDTWGVDFGLLDARGRLIGNPVHYRDGRTAGTLERMTQRVSRAEVYEATGIQFLEINTLNQLLAMAEAEDPQLQSAERLLLMPDLINHFLCGSAVSEYTNATTTQCFDPRHGGWALELVERLGVPARIFPEVVPPGTMLGTLAERDTRVVAPATHDTGSAVAAMPLALDGATAFVSSGTWSLVGLEVHQPVINEQALAANVTNEGGVAGTTRLLKNVMGLWLVQEARRALGEPGAEPPSYEALTTLAERAPSGTAFIDPDDARFLRPGDVRSAVTSYCGETRQPAPDDPGTLMRVLLESLALKYASVLGELQQLTGRAVASIYVVGGGARNELLCRLTANATGLPVLAGAAESTAIGNLIVQALALGELASLAEARELVALSFPARAYEPNGDWSAARERFAQLRNTGVIA
jgi:rhamnulokinase